MNVEDAVSPLDYRYYGVVERLYTKICPYRSEAARAAELVAM